MTQRRKSLIETIIGPYSGYLKQLKPLAAITFFLFAASLAIGYILGDSLPTENLSSILNSLPDADSMSSLQLLAYIFANNAGKSLIFMLSGLALGVFPLLFVVINGFVVGWLVYKLAVTNVMLLPFVGLVPHGIIEIPAILLCMAMGMSLGYTLMNQLRGKGGLKAELVTATRFFFTRIAPALFVAAVIETFITPVLLFMVV